MVVIVGASGSGKDCILNHLLENGYSKIITYTTRDMRENELNGFDYNFITKDEFSKLKKNGFFMEDTVYNGNFYGTPRIYSEDDKVNIVDPSGFESLVKGGDVVASIYVDVSEENRFNRMLKRGDSIEYATERLKKDKEVFTNDIRNKCDVVFDNNDPLTQDKIDKLIESLEVIKMYKRNKRPNYSIYI
jgi:guanylate kinase